MILSYFQCNLTHIVNGPVLCRVEPACYLAQRRKSDALPGLAQQTLESNRHRLCIALYFTMAWALKSEASRASEAVRAYREWAAQNRDEFKVTARATLHLTEGSSDEEWKTLRLYLCQAFILLSYINFSITNLIILRFLVTSRLPLNLLELLRSSVSRTESSLTGPLSVRRVKGSPVIASSSLPSPPP